MNISELDQHRIFEYFSLLSSVPHGSGNTGRIAELISDWAEEHGISYEKDKAGNLILRVSGTPGYEDYEGVILQGHMDMVCVKGEGCAKDMSEEGLDVRTDGETVWAEGTSLGADDCIGIAIVMAIITDEKLQHPPIEAIFTIDEETGMYGALGLDMSTIKGTRLINVDSEDEGIVTCGCAGGTRIQCTFPVVAETLNPDDICYRVTVDGLLGGHSGQEITKHRGNAGRLLARMLYGLSLKTPLKLSRFNGGYFDNAIMPSATAVVAVPKSDAELFERLTLKHEKLYRFEYGKDEPGAKVHLRKLPKDEYPEGAVIVALSKSMMRMISTVPDGLRKMSESFPGTAQTSSNIGIINLEREELQVTSLVRSMVPEERDEILNLFKSITEHDNGDMKIVTSFDPWQYKEDSELRELYLKVYKEQTGKEAKSEITHGGLEPGILAAGKPEIDCISIGPNIHDIHSEREKLDVASTLRTYDLLCGMLKEL